MSTYAEQYRESMNEPEKFWAHAAEEIRWVRKPEKILDDSSAPFYHWFPDASLNVAYNALDRHIIEGRGEQAALIYDSPVTGATKTYTYIDLLDRVAKFAGALRRLGVNKGDRVVIYMPMVPEAVIAMLASARLGAVHSVVFGGFGANELASRIDDVQPSVIVASSCGVEPSRVVDYRPMLDGALDMAAHRPAATVVLQRSEGPTDLRDGEYDFERLMRDGSIEPAEAVEVAATDPFYVLYTSGSTGKPKGIVRDGGSAVALRWSMKNLFNIDAGDVFFTASDIGWVVGHSYIVYAPLLAGATTVLFEGKPVGTPDSGTFWRIIADYGVKAIFTAPTAFRAIKRDDPDGDRVKDYDIGSLETVFLAGERLDPGTYHWAADVLDRPIVDNWWQTETGWPIVTNPRGIESLPIKPGSPTVPVPGFDLRVLTTDGSPAGPGEEGALVLKLPLPPGTLTTVWGADDRYVSGYLSAFDGFYLSGDGGTIDEDGYVFVMGRTDDVINVAGHRLSTGQIEAVLADHPAVAECAVIGAADPLKGQLPRGFVVLKSGIGDQAASTVPDELIAEVRARIGAVAAFKRVDVVDALPKTRSGKILRRTMRQMADGEDPAPPATIEDPEVLESLAPILKAD